jgi:hypothetical protein
MHGVETINPKPVLTSDLNEGKVPKLAFSSIVVTVWSGILVRILSFSEWRNPFHSLPNYSTLWCFFVSQQRKQPCPLLEIWRLKNYATKAYWQKMMSSILVKSKSPSDNYTWYCNALREIPNVFGGHLIFMMLCLLLKSGKTYRCKILPLSRRQLKNSPSPMPHHGCM